jgi:hypothetical protein
MRLCKQADTHIMGLGGQTYGIPGDTSGSYQLNDSRTRSKQSNYLVLRPQGIGIGDGTPVWRIPYKL